jgi:hypothetical protein
LGKVERFRGRFGALVDKRWATDGGGWCDEASRERGRTWVAVADGSAGVEGGGSMRRSEERKKKTRRMTTRVSSRCFFFFSGEI